MANTGHALLHRRASLFSAFRSGCGRYGTFFRPSGDSFRIRGYWTVTNEMSAHGSDSRRTYTGDEMATAQDNARYGVRSKPGVIAFVAVLNLALLFGGVLTARAALRTNVRPFDRFLFLIAAGWLVAIPCGFAWVTCRRRWKTGSWKMSEQERLQALNQLGLVQDGSRVRRKG